MTTGKLVRDRIPELIQAEGRTPKVKQLSGSALIQALYEKLAEEHAELVAAVSVEEKREELADLIEVILALARQYGCEETELQEILDRKRAARGGFTKGLFYEGDA